MGEIMERAFSFIWLFVALTLLGACAENPPTMDPSVQPDNEYGTSGGYLTEEGHEGESGEVPLVEGEGEEGPRTGETLSDYKIEPGDVLDINGARHGRELDKQVRVDDKGYVKLIYIDRVKVQGLTKWEAEDLLVQKYKRFFKDPQITVEILNLSYFIGGEVRAPGQKPIAGNITLTQAIQVAGGYTTWANKKAVTIKCRDRAGNPVILKFNCDKIDKGEERDPYVKPDDQITVPRGGGLLGG
jgi:polysaccharide export outer membrane protein